MRVKAKQYMYYDRRGYQAGEEYDMDDREEATAKLLSTLGKIEILSIKADQSKPQTQSAQPAQTYRTANLQSEDQHQSQPSTKVDPMTTEGDALTGPEKRTYRRRDMRPEK